MGIVAIDPDARWEHIPRALGNDEKPAEEQVVFILRGMEVDVEMEMFMDGVSVSSENDGRIKVYGMGKRALNALRHCVVGVRNFKDGSGQSIEFEAEGDTGMPTMRFLKRIPWAVRAELANAIVERERMTEEDVGK